MNIDRQGAGGAPRIDKAAVVSGRVPLVVDPLSGLGESAVSFSAVLAEIDPEAALRPGGPAQDPATLIGLPGDGREDVAPAEVPTWLMQGMAVASGVSVDPGSSVSGLSTSAPDSAPMSDPGLWLAQSMAAVPSGRPDSDGPATTPGSGVAQSGLVQPASAGSVDKRWGGAEPATSTPSDVLSGLAVTANAPKPADMDAVVVANESPAVASTGAFAEPKSPVSRRLHDSGKPSALGASLSDSGGSAARVEGLALAEQAPKSDWRTVYAAQTDRMVSLANPAQGENHGGFKVLAGLRDTEHPSGRSVFAPLDGVAAGAGAPAGYTSNVAPGPGTSAGADMPFASGSSGEVAQKVHYWITRGVQNAELQLDAFGGGAVDISISMQGNEAQVEFRSDQPEARRMLQDAMPQLRELLRSEGLELSGGFVGTSAQQDSNGSRDGSDMPRAKAGAVTVRAHDEAKPGRSIVGPTRALDVFV